LRRPAMPSLAQLLTLPNPLLLLLSSSIATTVTAASDLQTWPEVTATPTDSRLQEQLVRQRSLEIQERMLRATAPVGIRKMSADESEKFFWDYWDFGDGDMSLGSSAGAAESSGELPLLRSRAIERDDLGLANLTLQNGLLPPLSLHEQTSVDEQYASWWLPRSLFAKRAFQCPSNTRNCSSIQRPLSCCGMDEMCVIVEDTGLGDVGCCPSADGSNCGGQVSQCDTDAGFTSCKGSDHSGCCIPNYKCQGVGCEFIFLNTT
jgi:progranulin